MATISCSNAAQVQTALTSTAVAGDIIELANGTYTAVSNTATRTFNGSPVTIRPANRGGVIVRGGWDIRNVGGTGGVTIDGLIWESNQNDGINGGWPINTALFIQNTTSTKVTNCTFRGTAIVNGVRTGWHICVHFKGPNTNYEISYNDFSNCGMDVCRVFNATTNGWVHHNYSHDFRVDESRLDDPERHCDSGAQGNTGLSGGVWTRMQGFTYEYNWVDAPVIQAHGCFLHNEGTSGNSTPVLHRADLATLGHTNFIVRGNYIKTAHWAAIWVAGVHTFTITGNKIAWYNSYTSPHGANSTPGICICGAAEGGSVTNNVTPRAIGGNTINSSAPTGNQFDYTASGNTVSNTANLLPAGWTLTLADVGPYANTSPTGSVPNTLIASDWSVGAVVADPVFTTRYTAIIYIPSTSAAYNFAGLRWSQGVVDVSAGNGTTEGFTILSSLPDGTKRAQMTSASGNGHTVAPNTTFTDLRLYWRENSGGPLSSASDAKTFVFTPAQGPNVTSVTLNAATYTTGQTATATVNYTLGTGTLTSIAYQWKLDGGNVGSNQNTYVTAGAGSLTCTVTVTTSVSSAASTTAASTVAAPAVAPSISVVTLDKLSYTTGDTATATPTYTLGSGTLTSVAYQWKLNNGNVGSNQSTYLTTATGNLFCRVTVTSSVAPAATKDSATVTIGAPAPTAPAAGSWSFVDTEEVFTGRFTGQFRFPVGSVVSQSGLIGVQWSFDQSTWKSTTEVGVWTDGRRLFQLAGTTNEHTVGYDETSAPVYIRISTSTGTSGASADGLTFTGGPTPPPPPLELPAAADADWEIASVVAAPQLVNRFTGVIRATPAGAFGDDSGWIGVQWLDRSGVWADTLYLGTDGDGQKTWRMLPSVQGGSDHTVQYEQTKSFIGMRYITAAGTSLQSLPPGKSLTGPAFPVPDVDPGTAYSTGGDRIVVNGTAIVVPQDNRPSNIVGVIDVSVTDSTVQVVPAGLPPDAETFLLIYNGHVYTGTDAFSFPYVSGKNFGTIRAVNALGASSISRYFRIPAST